MEAGDAPDLEARKAEVVVLTGPDCMSSCDQFAAIMKDNGIATLAGLDPRGGHSPFRAAVELKLKNGAAFKITVTTGVGLRPDGSALDGNPARVDTRFWPGDSSLRDTLRRLSERPPSTVMP